MRRHEASRWLASARERRPACYTSDVSEAQRVRWELKYVQVPYHDWTHEEFTDEEEAQHRFRELSRQHPPVVNLSLRSHRLGQGEG